MNLKTLSRLNHSAIILSILTFAAVTTLTITAPATDIDSFPAIDDGIVFEDENDGFDETMYGEDEDIALGIADDDYAEAIYGDDEDEDEDQDYNSLFENLEEYDLMYIDTSFAWDNRTINAGRFDYKTLEPGNTIKIPLVDPSQNKLYAHPFANQVTSRFGLRGNRWHYGTDVRLRTGDPVKCAFDGIVRAIQFDRSGYGNVVVVRHHNGLETLYGHLSKVTVKPNQPISAGELVGLGGNTGRSTGSHLHFEIRYYGEPFNPEYIIDFDNYVLKSDMLLLTRDNFEYLTELRKTVYYTVRSGDNLSSIAKRHGTTVSNLCRMNGITPQTILRIGRRLIVRSGAEVERQIASPAPAQVSTNTQNTQAPPVQASPAIASDGYHTVRSGENLSSIAKRYGTTVSELCRLNGITADMVLSVGRRLVVMSGAEAERQPPTAKVSTNAQNVQVPTAQAPPAIASDSYHTIRSGENLSTIARRYGTTVNELCRLNDITPKTVLIVGRRLVVKSAAEAERQEAPGKPAQVSTNTQNVQAPAAQAPPEMSSDVYHTVRSGENLSTIARRYGTTVSELCRLNGITPQTVINTGRRLVVKSSAETEPQ